MENNNESKPVTRAHLFARIDATLLSQPSEQTAENETAKPQDVEIPAEDAEKK
ncbi:hypothetical protein [Achromobacter marplatensis]|uniref:hypothetical protein n=1 Tax=Achromobacter marplatensis TaxID=470868 RepID=UPI0028E4CFEE|nr:hypothetical protein [Achromobacter marplatensis]